MKKNITLFGIFAVAIISSTAFQLTTALAQTTTNVGKPSVKATPTPAPVTTAASTPAPTPTPEEIYKVDTELVNLNVRVIDRNNRPINDIQQKDFKIYEDGVLQQVDFFSRNEVPPTYSFVVDNSGLRR